MNQSEQSVAESIGEEHVENIKVYLGYIIAVDRMGENKVDFINKSRS